MTRIWYPLPACVKIKRYSLEMVGEKWNQNRCRVGSMSLLNMALVCIRVGLGTSHLIICLPPWVWVISFDLSSALCHVTMTSDPLMSNTAKLTVVLPYVQEKLTSTKFQPSSDSHLILIHKDIMFLCLVSMMWETLWPTFDQGHFLSTSAHYPGS